MYKDEMLRPSGANRESRFRVPWLTPWATDLSPLRGLLTRTSRLRVGPA